MDWSVLAVLSSKNISKKKIIKRIDTFESFTFKCYSVGI